MEPIERLKIKRATSRTSATKLVNKVTSFLKDFDIQNENDQDRLLDYLPIIEQKQTKLKSLDDEIENLITDVAVLEAEIQKSEEFQEILNEAKFEIKCKLRRIGIPYELFAHQDAKIDNARISNPVTDEKTSADLDAIINPRRIQNLIPATCNLSDSYPKTAPVQLLLGVNYFHSATKGETKEINKNLQTKGTGYGDTFVGQLPDGQRGKAAPVMTVSCSTVDTDLQRFGGNEPFLLDNESVKKKTSDVLNVFERNLETKHERYESPLMRQSNDVRENLGNNFEVAEKRFSYLEKRFERDKSLFEKYNAVMLEQIKEGIIEMYPDNCFLGYVLPHRQIVRESPRKHNPPDLLTRGIVSKDLISSEKCLHGPEWLKYPENLWPKPKDFDCEFNDPEIEVENKPVILPLPDFRLEQSALIAIIGTDFAGPLSNSLCGDLCDSDFCVLM